MPASPEISVIVPSHGRPLRLRWLLNALEEQTLGDGRWEAIVVHDYDAETAERVIERHPLGQSGVVRHIAIGPGTGPGPKRNRGWRDAAGELIAFTDDDCRPEPDWLERLVAAARRAPGDVVMGATRPDGNEWAVLSAPHVRTMLVDPPGPWAQTCNILYPRELLERAGGFDEQATAPGGEDVACWVRAEAAGAAMAAAPDAIVNHAVESFTLPGIVRLNLRWRHLAHTTRHHPVVRRDFPLRVFWDREHMWTTLAMIGALGASRHRALLVLVAPYVVRASGRRGPGPRQRALALAELPGQAVRQVAEVLGMAAGSVRHRTFVL